MAITQVDVDTDNVSKLLNLSIRDDTSLMDNPVIPMAMKKYSIRDFDLDLLFGMTMAENEIVVPPTPGPY